MPAQLWFLLLCAQTTLPHCGCFWKAPPCALVPWGRPKAGVEKEDGWRTGAPCREPTPHCTLVAPLVSFG